MKPLPALDLQQVQDSCRPAFDTLRGQHVFITGASGFVGSWLADTGAFAGVTITRHNGRQDGDIRSIALPEGVTHVIHCANAASGQMNRERPAEVVDMIVGGSAHVLHLCERAKVQKLLLLSSGSVYEKHSHGPYREDDTLLSMDMTTPVARITLADRFALAKRMAERQVLLSHVPTVVARGFAMIGPRLPDQFAAAEFMAQALREGPVSCTNPGTLRSFLYAADMAAWLWTLLIKGAPGTPYNIASSVPVTVGELAMEIAHTAGVRCVLGDGEPGASFLADTDRASSLVMPMRTCRRTALDRWVTWERA